MKRLGRIHSFEFPDMPAWMRNIYDARLLKGAMRNVTYLGAVVPEAGIVRLMYFYDAVQTEEGYWRVTFPNATKPAYYYNKIAALNRLSIAADSDNYNIEKTWRGERWVAHLKVKRDVKHREELSFSYDLVQALRKFAEEEGLRSWQAAAKKAIVDAVKGYYSELAEEEAAQLFQEVPHDSS
jgi:hypothetical protein